MPVGVAPVHRRRPQPRRLTGVRPARRSARVYRYELDDDDHVELLETLKRLPCKVVISGYAMRTLRPGKDRHTVPRRIGARAEEVVWMNYTLKDRRHDYSRLGTTFRS